MCCVPGRSGGLWEKSGGGDPAAWLVGTGNCLLRSEFHVASGKEGLHGFVESIVGDRSGARRSAGCDCRRAVGVGQGRGGGSDRKSTRLNSSHVKSSYAVFCLIQ